MIVLAAIFLSYPLYVWGRWGTLSSISASTYLLEGNRKGWFMAWLIALGVGSYFLDMGLYSHMMAVGFCVAGMSPDHRRNEISREDEFHTAGTAIAILSCYLGLGSLIAAAAFLAGAALLWIFARNRIWWIELLAFGVFVAGYVLL